jgi:hypothetical protein
MEQLPIGELAKHGLLAILLGLAITAWWIERIGLKDCWRDRLVDWKALADIIRTNGERIAEMVTSSDTRTRALEAQARAHDLSVQAQATLAEEVRSQRAVIAELRAEVARLREDIFRRPAP